MKKLTVFIIALSCIAICAPELYARKKAALKIQTTEQLSKSFEQAFSRIPLGEVWDDDNYYKVTLYFTVDNNQKVDVYHISATDKELKQQVRNKLNNYDFYGPPSLRNQVKKVDVHFYYYEN